jgi:hypothetical protein
VVDLFRTTHKVKTQQVVKNRGQHCGDVELAAYLANTTDPVPLVLDLRIPHDRFGSSSDPSLNGHLHDPNDIDRSINEAAADKIRKYRADYNNNPPSAVSFMRQSTNEGFFHFHRAAFFANLKSKRGNLLAKVAALRINLNLDGSPITSKSHTHPSHSQTSRLFLVC